MGVKNMTDKELQQLLNQMTGNQKDFLYRTLGVEYVKEDIQTLAENLKETFKEADIENMAKGYVFEGEYDCSISYWNKLEIILREYKKKQERMKPLLFF